MSVDLRKRIVDLSKKAAFAANRHGIEGQRAQVVLVPDISAPMNGLYKSGVISSSGPSSASSAWRSPSATTARSTCCCWDERPPTAGGDAR